MSRLQSWRWLLVAAAVGLPGCSTATESELANTPVARMPDRLTPASPTDPETTETSPPSPHTEQDRLALFDELVAATLRRHAFSDRKTAQLHLDFERDSAPLRDDFRTAKAILSYSALSPG